MCTCFGAVLGEILTKHESLTRGYINVGHRLRRWLNFVPRLVQRLLFAGPKTLQAGQIFSLRHESDSDLESTKKMSSFENLTVRLGLTL